jgi:hypothetical protein
LTILVDHAKQDLPAGVGPAGSLPTRETIMAARKTSKKPYVVVRDHRSGVYAGVLETQDQAAKTATLTEARKIWSWQGRLDTTDIANPAVGAGSKVTAPRERKDLNDVVDVSYASEAAEKNLRGFKAWER